MARFGHTNGIEPNWRTASAENSLVPAANGQSAAHAVLQLASEHDVPIRDDAALAAALMPLDIGRGIPPELFRAVADILTFFGKMEQK